MPRQHRSHTPVSLPAGLVATLRIQTPRMAWMLSGASPTLLAVRSEDLVWSALGEKELPLPPLGGVVWRVLGVVEAAAEVPAWLGTERQGLAERWVLWASEGTGLIAAEAL